LRSHNLRFVLSQDCRDSLLWEFKMVRQFKIIVEKYPDGYVAYPLGLKGIVVGQGDTYEEALADVKSAITFHIETFGEEVLESESPVLEAFVAEAGVAV
jgi:predicted RNase H-like HicB family nuclease